MAVDLDATVYAFDATTIDLCLSVYRRAPFRSTKAALTSWASSSLVQTKLRQINTSPHSWKTIAVLL